MQLSGFTVVTSVASIHSAQGPDDGRTQGLKSSLYSTDRVSATQFST